MTDDRKGLWEQEVYADFREEVDPYRDLHRFRPLNRAYTGDNTFWETPSPEPELPDAFWDMVKDHLDDGVVKQAAVNLAHAVTRRESDGNRLLFAAILRAGVPVADWLCTLIPGAKAAAMSLFVGLGPDRAALEKMKADYPDRRIVFVDGWTGRGGVARELRRLGAGPLAVLNDPWGWADFSGCREDIFCPSACFTGAATLGFSRTFFVDEQRLFAAYRFPFKYCKPDVTAAWRAACPPATGNGRGVREKKDFHRQTDLRIHGNEVCRALINADPRHLYFYDDRTVARRDFPLLLALAERRKVPASYDAAHLKDLKTRVACELNTA